MRAADALQLPFVDLLYGDLSPIATKTRFGVAFVAMTLGYAVVTALVLLAWILDRPRLLLAGLRRRRSASRPGCRCPATRASSRTPRSSPGSPTGSTSLRRCSGSAVSSHSPRASGRWPRSCGAARSSASRGSRPCSSRFSSWPAPISRSRACRPCPISGRRTYGQALLVKLAIVCVALGWGAVHHFFVRPRLERGERAAWPAAEPDRREHRRDPRPARRGGARQRAAACRANPSRRGRDAR